MFLVGRDGCQNSPGHSRYPKYNVGEFDFHGNIGVGKENHPQHIRAYDDPRDRNED
jgi:hypothetical protein